MALIRRSLIFVLLLLALASLYALVSQPVGAQDEANNDIPPVHVLTLKGIINPAAADYIKSSIEQAESGGAGTVVLLLDTPGGLDDSMREIIQAIDNSAVPVVVYVWPAGGRAASAGAFITMAAHVAAMAPGTTIGSATPIAIGASGDASDLPEDLRNKVVNEAVSYIRDHARLHGRNADWAETAVREGSNLPSTEALVQNVVDLLADDLDSLLETIDGWEVFFPTGGTAILQTAGAPLVRDDMSIIEQFLHVISNPNIAVILLSLATIGIFFELSSPGTFFPGVIGGIFLLLALYSLGALNAYWGGILLIVLAFILFTAEVFTPTFGILAAGGVASLVFGSFMLFSNSPSAIQVSPWAIATMAGVTTAFFVFIVRAILVSRRTSQGAALGYASLVGATGTTRTTLAPEGSVFVHGERWRATSTTGDIDAGAEVEVERVEGMQVWVRKKEE